VAIAIERWIAGALALRAINVIHEKSTLCHPNYVAERAFVFKVQLTLLGAFCRVLLCFAFH
jgi:hypothetical protein